MKTVAKNVSYLIIPTPVENTAKLLRPPQRHINSANETLAAQHGVKPMIAKSKFISIQNDKKKCRIY